MDTLQPVCSKETLTNLQHAITTVYVHKSILEYIVEIISRTRLQEDVSLGESQGTLSLLRISQAYVAIHRRHYVVPEDIIEFANHILTHRIILRTSYDPGVNHMQNIMERTAIL